MNETRVLVIDDSSTIRRLVDTELTASGYQVLLSSTAEEGIEKAAAELPDLILLDHQLPGTTGYDVCCQLLEHEQLRSIPVVISSTLRKKAYVEYVDAPNVVDMLPKPYTSELLLTTVENALNTATMVVQSQNEGSAVPETIGELADADLFGSFEQFSVREIVDLLNCGAKQGMLEVQTDRSRIFIHVDRGRIQAVTASGIDSEEVARLLPESLQELAPVVRVSVAGRQSSATDSLVELMNNKLLDTRLLRKLLRLQSAVLLKKCFTDKVKSFRFQHGAEPVALFAKLPLEISLIALLVESTTICDLTELPAMTDDVEYVRCNIRGQNLDRAGLSSLQMKALGLLGKKGTVQQFCDATGAAPEEMHRILCGFELSELVRRQPVRDTRSVVAVTENPERILSIQQFFKDNEDSIVGKVVSDWLALGLMMRRQPPHVLVVDADHDYQERLDKLMETPAFKDHPPQLVGWVSDDGQRDSRFAYHVQQTEELLACLSDQVDTQNVVSAVTGDVAVSGSTMPVGGN